MKRTVYPSAEGCKKCFEEAKRIWAPSHVSDLSEGICPIKADEVYVCAKTGQSITSTERVGIAGCPN